MYHKKKKKKKSYRLEEMYKINDSCQISQSTKHINKMPMIDFGEKQFFQLKFIFIAMNARGVVYACS